jgi:hypothetical protein
LYPPNHPPQRGGESPNAVQGRNQKKIKEKSITAEGAEDRRGKDGTSFRNFEKLTISSTGRSGR